MKLTVERVNRSVKPFKYIHYFLFSLRNPLFYQKTCICMETYLKQNIHTIFM